MADLVRGPRHPRVDDVHRIRRALDQPVTQFGHRRRQDEDTNDVAAGNLVQLLCTLPVDIEQHVLPVGEHRIDWRVRGTVSVTEDMRPFEKLMLRRHPAEFLKIDEVIVLPIDLAGADRPRRRGYRDAQFGLGGQELARDGGLTRARWRGQDEQHATALQVVEIRGGGLGHARQ